MQRLSSEGAKILLCSSLEVSRRETQDSPVALQLFSFSEFTVSTNLWKDLIKMRFLNQEFYTESKGSTFPGVTDVLVHRSWYERHSIGTHVNTEPSSELG